MGLGKLDIYKLLLAFGANIAEGYSINFYYNARGSLWESKHWFYLLYKRKLIAKEDFDTNMDTLHILGKKLNNFIQSIKKTNTKDHA